jgi:hypothetical protein
MAITLTCGLLSAAPADAQTRDASLLPPEQSGVITVAGCLHRGGEDGDKYVLAGPKLGPIANVPEDSCNTPVDERAVELKDADDHGINQSMLDRWVEINGRLERETSTDVTNLRELYVRSFRMLPVVPPPPAPEPRVQSEQQPITPPAPTITPPEEQPVATTGIVETTVETTLPQTASPLAMIGLLGLVSLAGGLGIHVYRSHERG